MPGCPGGLRAFSTAAEWLDFVSSLSLSAGIPEIVAAKFRRAQKLYFLAWLDFDLIKAGELAALITLELALKDRYGKKSFKGAARRYVPRRPYRRQDTNGSSVRWFRDSPSQWRPQAKSR
jgi:hypothetical protein